MCGGNKGQSTTSQTQTYTPNPVAANAITGAMQNAAQVAQTPFAQPVAPVAGFSADQQNAFNTTNAAQGMALPYINSAANMFGQSTQAPDINQFFNPFAGAVNSQMQNIFGQQDVQNNGSLTQAAGGVGADRIAVGQGNLANQQGLAAGQTFSSMFQPALGAAQQEQNILQSAGYGMGALGPSAQNSVLSGAQAQLGTGGLEQQLSQAQMNAPYQNILARLAYPFQTSNFLSADISALAGGMGGTTSGSGTATAAPPNMLSQLMGAGVAGAGIYGGLSGSGSGTNGTAAGGGLGKARGGVANSGTISPFAAGGVPTTPIDSEPASVVPNTPLKPMQEHIPTVNLNPPSQSSGSSGPSMSDIANVAKVAMMFAKRGGRVDPKKFDGYNPYFAEGGDTDTAEPFRMPDQAAVDAWRKGVDSDMGAGMSATSQDGTPGDLPSVITSRTGSPGVKVMSFSGDPDPSSVPTPRARPGAAGDGASTMPGSGGQGVSATSQGSVGSAGGSPFSDFIKSPWAALTAAGLGMMGGTSPYAGVNIGQGGMQGIKMLQTQREEAQKDETVAQAAKRLQQEADFHNDQYTKSTPYQQFEMSKPVPAGQVFDPQTGLNRTQFMVQDGKNPDGTLKWKPVAGEPVLDENGQPVKGMPAHIGDAIIAGDQPPDLTTTGRLKPQVSNYLAGQGFKLAQAQLEWKMAGKQIQALNGPQMMRGYNLYKSVNSTIDEVKALSSQMELGGVPLLNKLQLDSYIQTEGNSDKGQLALRYRTAVNTLKEEFANLANGGYAPTEPAWALANEQVNGNYGVKALGSSLDEIKRLVGYRMQFVANSPMGPGAANRYTGNAGGSDTPPPAETGKPDYATRKAQLQQSGLQGDALFSKLHQEGY